MRVRERVFVVVVCGNFLRSCRRRSKDLRKWPERPSHPSSLIMFFSLERTPLDDLPEDMWKWGWRSLGACVQVCVEVTYQCQRLRNDPRNEHKMELNIHLFLLRVLARMTSAGLTRHTQDIIVVVVIFLVLIRRHSVSPSHFSALGSPYHCHHYHQRSDNFSPAEIESCVWGVKCTWSSFFAVRRFVCPGRRGRTRWLRCDRRAVAWGWGYEPFEVSDCFYF